MSHPKRVSALILLCSFATGCLLVSWHAQGATPGRLTLDEMSHQSTAIERVKVIRASSVHRDSDLYTIYKLQIIEVWKPAGKQNPVEVVFPNTAPPLRPGDEYVMFMRPGSDGLPEVTGTSQGLFKVRRNASGSLIASRAVTAGSDDGEPNSFKLSQLKAQVAQALWDAK